MLDSTISIIGVKTTIIDEVETRYESNAKGCRVHIVVKDINDEKIIIDMNVEDVTNLIFNLSEEVQKIISRNKDTIEEINADEYVELTKSSKALIRHGEKIQGKLYSFSTWLR